jgi:sigma-B regulation protein RsbU (phosphoserine phosphatase)
MSSKLPGACILVVDDDPGVLRAVTRVLGSGYALSTASSPSEALVRAVETAPDLAILDIRMPTMDGFELMQRLKEHQPDLDVIFITGSMSEPDAHLIRAIRQGAFYFTHKPFDREVLLTLVERCLELRRLRAVADNELNKLRVAQSRLLPQTAPVHPEYRIAFHYRPFYFATGDYHGFFPQADESLAVFIGDSCGHGPSACMLMATMRTLLHTHPEFHGDPGQALASLNRHFHRLIPADLFMTAVYLLLERNGMVRWAVAGQPAPLHVSSEGLVLPVDQVGGIPLGIEAEIQYKTVTRRIPPGDTLILFTDGIVEASNRNGKLLGLKGIRHALGKRAARRPGAEVLVNSLIDEVRNYMDGAEFEDDFTLLAIERR